MEKQVLSVLCNAEKKLLGIHVGPAGYHTVSLDDLEDWDTLSLEVGALGILRMLTRAGKLTEDGAKALAKLLPVSPR